jgi:CubicO group peptidase (beta-lactamase class C family)
MRLSRRTIIGAAAAATLAGCNTPPRSPRTESTPAPASPAGTPSPDSIPPVQPLRTAPAAYADAVTAAAARYLVPTPDRPRYPTYAGAVVLAVVDGAVTVHSAVGDALRYGPGPVELPAERRIPMRPDSIFDLASITKVFTAIAVMQQVERGRIEVGAPVGRYLTEFDRGTKRTVTVEMLLAHRGGLPDNLSLAGQPDAAARRKKILATEPTDPPGKVFRYSDVNLLVLGEVLQKVTGEPLDALIRKGIIDPLSLTDTGFRPQPGERLVATDAGLARGTAHDPNARALGGVAAHAGLFGTARDLALLGQAFLDGRILTAESIKRMTVDANHGIPAVDPENRPDRTSAHGLGLEVDQKWFMGALAGGGAFGHTGFTGVSLVVAPARRVVLVLLTNRAHPDWRRSQADAARQAVANTLVEKL